MSALELISVRPADESGGYVWVRVTSLRAGFCMARYGFCLYRRLTIIFPLVLSSLNELVEDGQNGFVFKDATQLADHLVVRFPFPSPSPELIGVGCRCC
jgi:hypothetical protein